MIEGSIVTLCVGGWLLSSALREDGERQQLVDFARSRDVSLSLERAGRAVRAGRGSELRERVEAEGGGSAGERSTQPRDLDDPRQVRARA